MHFVDLFQGEGFRHQGLDLFGRHQFDHLFHIPQPAGPRADDSEFAPHDDRGEDGKGLVEAVGWGMPLSNSIPGRCLLRTDSLEWR
jgi:hypothetical protein